MSRRGGAQEREGVIPDLTVLGKIIGGGLPAAAYAGRRELMERIAPAGDVYQAGTLSGNPLARRPGWPPCGCSTSDAYASLDRTTRKLAEGLEEAAPDAGVPRASPATTGLLTLFFAERPPRNYEEARACDLEAHAAFCRGDARPRHLPAALAVRGLVPLAGAHGRARGAHVGAARAVLRTL